MHILLFFIICLVASTIGAISGIGGGVIIKPIIDITSIVPISVAHFLSGCTVLSMSTFSMIINRKKPIELNISLFLAIGGILGGLVGRYLYSHIHLNFLPHRIGFYQSFMLMLINISVLIFVFNQNRIKFLNCKNKLLSLGIGLILGIISTFLGIGGGALNVVTLYYFYSMDAKKAAHNSLFIIFCSQLSSLILSAVNSSFPPFEFPVLILMCFGGVLGAILGKRISSGLTKENMDKLFKYLTIVLIILNICNIIKFSMYTPPLGS